MLSLMSPQMLRQMLSLMLAQMLSPRRLQVWCLSRRAQCLWLFGLLHYYVLNSYSRLLYKG